MLARDAEITKAAEEAAKEAVVRFKDSEEFTTFLEEKHDAGHDTGYDAGV